MLVGSNNKSVPADSHKTLGIHVYSLTLYLGFYKVVEAVKPLEVVTGSTFSSLSMFLAIVCFLLPNRFFNIVIDMASRASNTYRCLKGRLIRVPKGRP